MNEKTDSKAVEKTKCRLRMALNELLKLKPVNKISVRELTEKAYLSRATFYLYYSDIDEFYKDSMNYVYQQFTKQLIKFLRDGVDKAEYNCKAENMIISSTDCELLGAHMKHLSKRSECENILSIFFDGLVAYAHELHDDSYFENKRIIFRIFAYGYIYSMMDVVIKCNSVEIYNNLVRCYHLGDYLFAMTEHEKQ
ncbi:MAG: hypothetical protein NC122_00530 [Faecalibacterium sp.]|nr:hypothetical protein [Ruminococcus sp.]MCM1392980.1 hypothetical protein [Ruminococcus sp.]MCM1484674.1 hypothetical protein [Faecalibacterium sp.]